MNIQANIWMNTWTHNCSQCAEWNYCQNETKMEPKSNQNRANVKSKWDQKKPKWNQHVWAKPRISGKWFFKDINLGMKNDYGHVTAKKWKLRPNNRARGKCTWNIFWGHVVLKGWLYRCPNSLHPISMWKWNLFTSPPSLSNIFPRYRWGSEVFLIISKSWIFTCFEIECWIIFYPNLA